MKKVIIKEEYFYKPRKLFVNFEGSNLDDSEVKIIYSKTLGFCMHLNYFLDSKLTSIELRGIADKLDEYNKEYENNKK